MEQDRAINIKLEFPNVYKTLETAGAENKRNLKIKAMLTPKNTLWVPAVWDFLALICHFFLLCCFPLRWLKAQSGLDFDGARAAEDPVHRNTDPSAPAYSERN